ncbi:MAG TPA: ECF-type sigma factor, partial [Rudaea sp.]
MHDERPTDPREITRLLAAWSGGDALAAAELSEIAYAQIHKLAQAQLRRAPGAHTLQPTELAHELFVKLLGSQASWNDRRHFYASVALAMRRLLVDAARARRSEKRGGDQLHVTLSAAGEVPIESDDAEALDGIFDE